MAGFETEYDQCYKRALNLLQQGGSTTEVYEHIRTINDGDYRDRTFEKLGRHLVEQGNLVDALRFCAAIVQPLARADALFEVGRVLRRKGDLDAAKNVFDQTIETAGAIKRDYDRAAVFVQVAYQLERLGAKEEALTIVYRALELVKSIPQNFEASKTLRGCARILAKWNRLQEAIEAAEAIDRQWSALRETTLEEVQGRGRWAVQPGAELEDDG